MAKSAASERPTHLQLFKERLGAHLRFRENVPASDLTTFSLGAPVPLVVEPMGITGISLLLTLCKEEGIPWRILGAGSNVLLPDESLRMPVICLGKIWSGYICSLVDFLPKTLYEIDVPLIPTEDLPEQADADCHLIALAGAPLMGLSRKCTASGLSGLEFAAGIPGSLGGAVRMNAGAHKHQMSEIVTRCLLVNKDGDLSQRDTEELEFGYRHSSVADGEIVLAAELRLEAKSKVLTQQERAECLQYRRDTQPLHLPSAGSVFRNPTAEEAANCPLAVDGQLSAAHLLERAGFKGKVRGGLKFSDMHSNWLVTCAAGATSADARALIDEAITVVQREFGIRLKPEIDCW